MNLLLTLVGYHNLKQGLKCKRIRESGKRVREVYQGWGQSQDRVKGQDKSDFNVISVGKAYTFILLDGKTQAHSSSLHLWVKGRGSNGSREKLQYEPQACTNGGKSTPCLRSGTQDQNKEFQVSGEHWQGPYILLEKSWTVCVLEQFQAHHNI